MANLNSNYGYYRFPTIARNSVVFISEDDLWAVDLDKDSQQPKSAARRLSANPGSPTTPVLSPDGKQIAFISRDEGMPEVYVIPASGGTANRLTFLGSNTRLVGWHPAKANTVLFVSDVGQPFLGHFHLYEISAKGGSPNPLNLGPAFSISFEPHGHGSVINRNGGGRRSADPAMWKRYRGGTAGQIWIDRNGKGQYERILAHLRSDLANPMWIGKRIYFLSDHEGVGNIYSCTPSGKSIKRHTNHGDYYVRFPKTDGMRIVYAAGAQMYVFDSRADERTAVKIETPSTFPQRNRKFTDAARYLESYDLHPKGHSLCVVSRGKPVTFALWEGAVNQLGSTDCSARFRFAQFVGDGETVAAVSDESGDERVVLVRPNRSRKVISRSFDLGRVIDMKVAPTPKPTRLAVCNHRYELIILDLSATKPKQPKVVDRSKFDRIANFAWSPDGRYLVYSLPDSPHTAGLKVYDLKTGKKADLTNFDFLDTAPTFDSEGNYLYFISYREFDPVYDNHFFDLGFPRGMRLLAIPLRRDLPSPFEPQPRAPGAPAGSEKNDGPKKNGSSTPPKRPRVRIDVRGIQDRVVAMPIPEGRFGSIRAIEGKILFSSFPIEGSLGSSWAMGGAPDAKGVLECWDLNEQKRDTLVSGITSFEVSRDSKTLCYRAGNRLRALKAGTKPPNEPKCSENSPSRASGWIDLSRIKLSIEPVNEWRQMFVEAWRLQRDQFWVEDMSGTDWKKARDRYEPLVARVSCRSEFSDLMWELQGELGTSHAYEIGGDYRQTPPYRQAFLGADLRFDNKANVWRITRIPKGDSWRANANSPLKAPNVNVKENDRLFAVDHHRVNRTHSPAEFLVNRAGEFVVLTVSDPSGRNKRDVTVKALSDERPLRYRNWVESNREYVHKKSRGKIGYVHIPDMGPNGYSEFHRYYHPELKIPSLIVDVRYNGGGHVSQIILEKLLRKRVGYDLQRWGEPVSYPDDAALGPIVAVTNQNAGSDGDIFSHCFKLFKIGPLIGTRTWGGVVGIWPRHYLVDGSITTQPEFSFWFEDVGFGVENYGTDPDIEVEITPQDYASGRDTQLDRAIKETQMLEKKNPSKLPQFGPRPKLGLPTLPKKK